MNEEVQEYRDMTKMTKEELAAYIQKPYKTKNGIVVTTSFTEGGGDINEYWQHYLRMKLES